MSLDSALFSAQSQVPDCIASGYVDMSTGTLMAVRTLDSHPQEVLDLIAATTADLFQGPNVQAIENMFNRSRGTTSSEHYFKEMLVFSSNLLHIFLRGKRHPDHVLVLVCHATANVGSVLTKGRQVLLSVESAA